MIGAAVASLQFSFVLDQCLLLGTRQFLDFNFPFLSAGAIRLRFHISQPHGTASTGVTRPASGIVLAQPSFGICSPTGVIGAIGAFQYIAVKVHRSNKESSNPENLFWFCGRQCAASCRTEWKPSIVFHVQAIHFGILGDREPTTIDPALCGPVLSVL